MEKKFKAKRLDTGEWVEFNLDTYSCHRKGCTPYVDKHLAHQMPINKNTICQYTGISDSEGNRIFEGDEVYVAGVGNVIVSVDVNGVHCGDEPYICCYGDIEHLTGHNIHDRG